MARKKTKAAEEPKTRCRAPEDQADRVEYAKGLISRALYRSEIVKRLKQKFGLEANQAERIADDARDELYREHRDRTGEEWLILSIEVYRSILADENADPELRIKAQTRIDKILGLEKQQPVTLLIGTGAAPGPEQIERARMLGIPVEVEEVKQIEEVADADLPPP